MVAPVMSCALELTLFCGEFFRLFKTEEDAKPT